MRIAILTFCVLVTIACRVAAQQKEEQAIMEPVNQVFKGIEKGDSTMVRNAFTKEVTMASVFRDKNGNPMLRRETSLASFLKAVGTPHDVTWYEEVWNLKIQQDGDFAQVWCDYAFYVGKNLSHCGVDAFQLHKTTAGWKIFHLADTRRKEGCDVPQEIQDRRK